MDKGEEILAIAAREIGYHEGAGKHNKYGEWFGRDNVAWCMEFVQWCYHEAGIDLPLKTPSCGGLLGWYKRNQPECVTDRPVPGCVVIFDFPSTKYTTDHTGLFVKCDGGYITTIDGNTGNGSDSNGGWVQQKTRRLAYANPTYIVPRSLADEKQEDDMERYQTLDEIKEKAPWAAPTVEKLMERDILRGGDRGFDLSTDMLRLLVMNDRAGIYDKEATT